VMNMRCNRLEQLIIVVIVDILKALSNSFSDRRLASRPAVEAYVARPGQYYHVARGGDARASAEERRYDSAAVTNKA